MRVARKCAANDNGAVLPLALVVILVIGLFVLGAIAALQGPTRVLGAFAKQESEYRDAESRLEHARALLIADPTADLSPAGVSAQWSPMDSTIIVVSAGGGEMTLIETWAVTAPSLHVVHADSGITITDSVGMEGDLFDARDYPFADTGLVETAIFANFITRAIRAQQLDGVTIRNEVVELTPLESGPVVLRDIEIDRGLLIVNGDVVIEGRFKAEARDGLPFLVISGNLLTTTHPEPWRWRGLIAVRGDAFFAGPIEFEGTILARAVEIIGGVQGKGDRTKTTPAWPVTIVRSHREMR